MFNISMFNKFFFCSLFFLSFIYAVDETQFISPEEVKLGDTLQSKTRMENNEMYPFKMRVGSILKDGIGLPRDWIVLAHIEDERLQKTGVLAGMSGSPVYFKGKLLGAVAMTIPSQKGVAVMIRSIYSMLRVSDDREALEKMPGLLDIPGAKPVQTPIMIVGSSLKFPENLLDSVFDSNYKFIAGGAETATENEEDSDAFEAGDALSVPLVRGDISLAAIGTVTYVDSNTVLAFGHPFLSGGSVYYPLHKAKIDTVISHQILSYKIGSVGKEVGSIIEDRTPAIMGRYKVLTQMIPMKLYFKTPTFSHSFSFEIIPQKEFFMKFVRMLTLGAVSTYGGDNERNRRIVYETRVKLKNREKPVVLKGLMSQVGTPTSLKSMMVDTDMVIGLNFLLNNPFEEVQVERVDVDVSLEYEKESYTLKSVSLEKREVFPLENVDLNITLANFQGKSIDEKITFQIPSFLKKGFYKIGVLPIRDFYNFKMGMTQGGGLNRFDDVISFLERGNVSDDSLVVYIVYPDTGIKTKTSTYEDLPLNYFRGLMGKRALSVMNTSSIYYKTYSMKLPFSFTWSPALEIEIEMK